ncbi:MAG: hypothetical protein U1E62_14090 [Alsobacter sp.]
MRPPMSLAFPRWLFLLAALLLAAAIAWATGAGGSIVAAVGRVAAEPWGMVMLVDLYAGFLATAALFFLLENRVTALLLLVALMVLGNVVTLIWLAVRGWTILRGRLA